MKILQNKLSALRYVALVTSWAFLDTVPASADVLWDWDYSCTFKECKGGSGTFTTTGIQGSGINSYYLVTGMTGEVEGNTITSLIPPGEAGTNDNKLSGGGDPFENAGYKVTGIAFLTNNDPLTTANVNRLYSVFVYAGYDIQLYAPDNLAIENIRYSSRMTGTVASGEADRMSSRRSDPWRLGRFRSRMTRSGAATFPEAHEYAQSARNASEDRGGS